MTLGNKIYELRTKAGFSQEELAEKTGVSRQSVSKWETDASIPELDKLIQLSKLFEITLDSLVQDESTQIDTKSAFVDTTENSSMFTTDNADNLPTDKSKENTKNGFFTPQRIVGLILFTVALLGILLSLIFLNDFVTLVMILSFYCLLSGILCLTVKKHLGLAMGIMTFVFLLLSILFLTGIMMNPFAPIETAFEA